MKTYILIPLLFLYTLISAQDYRLQSENSQLKWTGKAAFNAYALTGTLTAKSGLLTIKNDSIQVLKVRVNMESLDHENKQLKSHLRSKDFFEVKKYKEAFFVIENPVRLEEGITVIRGKMRIKDTVKDETIALKISKIKTQLVLSFEAKLNRIDYGVTFNSPSVFKKLKENAIADEFVLKGELIFVAN